MLSNGVDHPNALIAVKSLLVMLKGRRALLEHITNMLHACLLFSPCGYITQQGAPPTAVEPHKSMHALDNESRKNLFIALESQHRSYCGSSAAGSSAQQPVAAITVRSPNI